MEILKNDFLTVTLSSKGAELISIKDAEGTEYLWDGDAKYWGRHSPILFPIVCGLWEDTYRINGLKYHMSRHGFARDMEFEVTAKEPNSVCYELLYSDETLEMYPYKFKLLVSYILEENHITVCWQVSNFDNQTIYFQIGGHPAFIVPGNKKGKSLKGKLIMDSTAIRLFGNEGGCLKEKHKMLETHRLKDEIDFPAIFKNIIPESHCWDFTEHSFDDDAIIIDRSQVHEITILDEEECPHVVMEFNTPCVGIWSPAGKHAPFVCIEPWYGIADKAGFKGEFKDKYLMNSLQPGGSFLGGYHILLPKAQL